MDDQWSSDRLLSDREIRGKPNHDDEI